MQITPRHILSIVALALMWLCRFIYQQLTSSTDSPAPPPPSNEETPPTETKGSI